MGSVCANGQAYFNRIKVRLRLKKSLKRDNHLSYSNHWKCNKTCLFKSFIWKYFQMNQYGQPRPAKHRNKKWQQDDSSMYLQLRTMSKQVFFLKILRNLLINTTSNYIRHNNIKPGSAWVIHYLYQKPQPCEWSWFWW